MVKSPKYDAIVIGGGFFGCKLSLYLKQSMNQILILEKEPDLMQRASYVNQARVHNGYHYPRSILTALRSRVSFPQFVSEYRECIASDFDKYYAVGQIFSKVNANQFKIFCERIGAPIEIASQSIKTVLPQSEVDDSRILFKRNQKLPNLLSVLGGKIDNVYDLPGELKFLEY